MAMITRSQSQLAEQYEYLMQKLRQKLIDSVGSGYKVPIGLGLSDLGRFADEIIALNQFISTEASTNFPEDPTFQPMFISGFIHKKYVTEKFIECLKTLGLTYMISKVNKSKRGVYSIEPVWKDSCVTDERFVLAECLSRALFFPNRQLSVYAYDHIKNLKPIVDKYSLPTTFRKLYHRHGFEKAYKMVTDKDNHICVDELQRLITLLREGGYDMNKYIMNMEITGKHITDLYEYGMDKDLEKILDNLFLKKQIYMIEISDNYYPTDRILYRTLNKYFSNL
jgi:hypothetical protein